MRHIVHNKILQQYGCIFNANDNTEVLMETYHAHSSLIAGVHYSPSSHIHNEIIFFEVKEVDKIGLFQCLIVLFIDWTFYDNGLME